MSDMLDINKIAAEAITSLVDRNTDKLFVAVKSKLKDSLKKTQVDFNTAFKHYLERAHTKYSYVKTLLYSAPRYFYNFYESNYLKGDKCGVIDTSNINHVLDISRFILISGSAGTGKTLMLKHLFLNSIKHSDLIPIYVELRGLKNTTLSLCDYIFEKLESLGFSLEFEYFKYALKTGCFLLLLDGLDEVEDKTTVLNKIGNFCDRYSDNYYIVTSRPSSADIGFVSLQRFTVLKISPLTKKQACNLVSKIEFDIDVKARFLVRLDTDLFNKHKTFAANPLLLTIMLLTFESYAEIPEKVHVFYSNAVDTLFSKHDATKEGYRRRLKCKIALDDFKSVISELCFKLYIKRHISFSKDAVADVLKSIPKAISANINEIIADLVESVCILQVDGLEFSFTHRSFQEYFTALFLKELNDEQQKVVCARMLRCETVLGTGDESVFGMLYDMSKTRFENNVLLPFFEETIAGSVCSYFSRTYTYILLKNNGLRLGVNDFYFLLDAVLDLFTIKLAKPILSYSDEHQCIMGEVRFENITTDLIAEYVSYGKDKLTANDITMDKELAGYLFGKEGVITRDYNMLSELTSNLRKNQLDVASYLESYLQ